MEIALTDLAALDGAVAQFLRAYPKGAIVAMHGELGAGKTTFVRTVIRHLAAGKREPRVISPTFVFHQSYPNLQPPVEHFDLYRLDRADSAALVEIGYYEALERTEGKRGFVFVEWPERASTALLRTTVKLELELAGEGRRLRYGPP